MQPYAGVRVTRSNVALTIGSRPSGLVLVPTLRYGKSRTMNRRWLWPQRLTRATKVAD